MGGKHVHRFGRTRRNHGTRKATALDTETVPQTKVGLIFIFSTFSLPTNQQHTRWKLDKNEQNSISSLQFCCWWMLIWGVSLKKGNGLPMLSALF